MKRNLLVLQFFIAMAAFGQNYSIALIPDSLLKKADAVQRINEHKLIIHSIKSATLKHKYAYTILNEAGSRYAGYGNIYTDLDRLTDVVGKLFDASGKQLKQVKKKDMDDVAYSGSNLMSDARLKGHNFYYKTYPYTIEYEEEEDYNGIYSFPDWQPLNWFNYSVQSSSYIIEMPADYKLRYKLINGATAPVEIQKGNTKILTWQANNIKALEYEPYHPDLDRILPLVLIGPEDMEYGGYKGNLSTWDNYGKYVLELLKGRDILPENIKADIHKITNGVSDKMQIIQLLYNYLQQNTHYISIQLGIGSLQPFDAKFVAEKKYGDCKALSNYMVSLLAEAGVKSYPALIYGGDNFPFIFEDFPQHYFNHMVTCVPNGKDSVWLECTDQTKSAGFAGSFTGNRKALLVKEEGSMLVSTPKYTAKDNLQQRKIIASIDTEGNLMAAAVTYSTGEQQETQHGLLYDFKPEDREKYLNSTLNLPTYKIDKIEYQEIKGILPAMIENLNISSPNYATVTGKRLFILPNLFNKASKLKVNDERHFDVVLDDSYKDIDSIFIKLPEGYVVESLPKDVSIKNKFGSYGISFKVKDNTIELVRLQEQEAINLPASEYKNLVEYFDNIFKADRSRIVLLKQ